MMSGSETTIRQEVRAPRSTIISTGARHHIEARSWLEAAAGDEPTSSQRGLVFNREEIETMRRMMACAAVLWGATRS